MCHIKSKVHGMGGKWKDTEENIWWISRNVWEMRSAIILVCMFLKFRPPSHTTPRSQGLAVLRKLTVPRRRQIRPFITKNKNSPSDQYFVITSLSLRGRALGWSRLCQWKSQNNRNASVATVCQWLTESYTSVVSLALHSDPVWYHPSPYRGGNGDVDVDM